MSAVQADLPQVRMDLSEVQADLPQVHMDLSEVQADLPQVHMDLSEVQSDLPQVHSDFTRAQANIIYFQIKTKSLPDALRLEDGCLSWRCLRRSSTLPSHVLNLISVRWDSYHDKDPISFVAIGLGSEEGQSLPEDAAGFRKKGS